MKSKLIALILLSASLAFAWNGSGTYEDPYEIATASDVADLATAVNGGASQSGVYFLQTADIDLSTFGNFTPIGSASAPFAGNYDGDGYILSNLTITASVSGATTNAFGFFGYCKETTIENVSVYGSIKVDGTYNANACVGIGGVVGLSVKGLYVALKNYCDIEFKLINTNTSTSSSDKIKYGVGGCIGLIAVPPTSLTQHQVCENYGNISFEGMNGACCLGGCVSAFGNKMTFVGFNNFGKVYGAGNGSAGNSSPVVSGVISNHNNLNDGGSFANAKSCSNFGSVITTNGVHTSGVMAKGLSANLARCSAESSTNYADIISYIKTSRSWVGGIVSAAGNYADDIVFNCVNKGKIIALGNGTGIPQLGGVFAGNLGYAEYKIFYNNKNFGDIEANCPNASSVVVGGVITGQRKIRVRNSENYGNIKISTDGSVLVGGVASVSSSHYLFSYARNCVNYGNIVASGNSNTNYSPCVSSVFASTRITDSQTRDITISNCYNLGQAKLNLNDDGCYGAIYGVANTYGNYGVSIKNCYAVVGEGQTLIGAVDASNGNVSLENCVGIKSGVNGGIAYSVSGSNNWSQANTTIVAYEDCYTNPYQCYGNMGSGIFTPADKTTNYFDLILPINTKLYPTPSATDKKNHTYTKAQGYKRYVKTNRK